VSEVDSEADSEARLAGGHGLGVTADLTVVRADLAEIEALEHERRHRLAHLRALLPPAQFRLVWALLDVQERLGLAAQLLAEHAATVRAATRRVPEGDGSPGDRR